MELWGDEIAKRWKCEGRELIHWAELSQVTFSWNQPSNFHPTLPFLVFGNWEYR